MSTRGRSESPGWKSNGIKRSDSQESKYSGDAFYSTLEDEDYTIIDQTVESELGELDEAISRYRTNSPPNSPGKRKVEELDRVEDGASKVSRANGGQVSRADSWSTNITTGSFSGGETGTPPLQFPPNPLHIVAFSRSHQGYFDKHLPWGAQWEIARLITHKKLKYDDLPLQELVSLQGKNNATAAPEIEKILCPAAFDSQSEVLYRQFFTKELESQSPWSELDTEEERLKDNPLCGLGCQSLHNDWYGGKIAFTAKVREDMDGRRYFLQLEKPELSTSTRFARRWGSRRFIRVRIPDDLLRVKNNNLFTYFQNDFVINGKIFRTLYSKEHTVFLVQLPERTTDGITRIPDVTGCIGFPEFLEWHNPMALNKKQTLAKWCARMALGLSNSVPGLQFKRGDIHEIDDVYSLEGQAMKNSGNSPDAKFVLTDGAGYCNYAVLSCLRDKFNWDRFPCAIQFRTFGAKGLLVLHPKEEMKSNDAPQIWLRPSQKKITYEKSSSLDRAHLILDVLRRSEFRTPARLSTQIIVNLAENNVSYDILQTLMNLGLEGIAASLTAWSGPYSMQNLWNAVSKINGSVFFSRAAREAGGTARVLGLSNRDRDEDEGTNSQEDTENLQSIFKSKAYWPDEVSGCPASLEDTVMALLDSGFEPQSCGLLAKTLREVFKKALSSYIDKYKIEIPQSGEGWMIPDPVGVLEPGEIFLKASNSLFELGGVSRDHLLGPVLITRHPCCVPSDVQKVKAVWYDELARYSDVIVCSTRGSRSLASMLGGGDYDGDTAHVIWHPEIVKAFKNADEKFADPPPKLEEAFKKDTKTVEDYMRDSDHRPVNRRMQELQEYLIAALRNSSLVGRYSSFHDIAVYRLGYKHDEAWRLAYMFCAVLDGSKTGKVVRPLQMEADNHRYNGRRPEWTETLAEERDNKLPSFNLPPRREPQIQFIMDLLKENGRRQYGNHLKEFERLLNEARNQYRLARGEPSACYFIDPILQAPAVEIRKRAEEMDKTLGSNFFSNEIKVLEHQVQKSFEEYKKLMRTNSQVEGPSFTRKPKQERQDKLRKLSLAFAQVPTGIISLSRKEIDIFKASYAYDLDSEREKRDHDCARFPFDIAMRTVCSIKAESTGNFKTISSTFYPFLDMSHVINKFQS